MRVKVFCVGLSAKDSIYYLPSFPTGEGKYLAKELITSGGGPAATAATTITRLGGQASLFSRVGDDLVATELIKELQRYKVNTTYVKRVAAAQSTLATVIIDGKGDRIIVSYSDPRLYISELMLSEAEKAFIRSHDAVVVDTRWSGAGRAVLAYTHEQNIPSILDGEVSIDHCVRELAPLARYPIFSMKGLVDFLELDDTSNYDIKAIEEMLQTAASKLKAAATVIVTYGAHGVFYLANKAVHRIHAYKVNVVDTVGAGDVFHGTFAYYLRKKHTLETILKYACAAAALKCTAPSGRGCLPTPAMLENFLTYAETLP